jgi:hypothetical protein
MAESTTPSSASHSPVLTYSNWTDWCFYWRDRLAMVNLWQYTDPSTDNILPPSTSSINREVIKRAYEEGRRLCDYVAPKCWRIVTDRVLILAHRSCHHGLVVIVTDQRHAYPARSSAHLL